MNFIHALRHNWSANNSLLCVGLDPDPVRFPACLRDAPDAIWQFCRHIVDATADQVCCFKPQIAYFAAHGAEDALTAIIDYIHQEYPAIPVILDAKRGDIGSTATQYAREAFERFKADAVTLNPYMGEDSLRPFLDHHDKGIILLCRTSNPGGSDIQNLLLANGKRLFEHLASTVHRQWNQHDNCALVVGATFPTEMAKIRQLAPDMPLLVPGIGAQGGNIAATVTAGKTEHNDGLMISSSRAILYASPGEDFAEAARAIAIETKNSINIHRFCA